MGLLGGLFGGNKSSSTVSTTNQQFDQRVGVEGDNTIALGAGANFVQELPPGAVEIINTLADVAAVGVGAAVKSTSDATTKIAELQLSGSEGTARYTKQLIYASVAMVGLIAVAMIFRKG